jgi:hypothetical protein
VTDAAGAFRVERLLPGLEHQLFVGPGAPRKVSAGAGEVKALGDVTAKLGKKEG